MAALKVTGLSIWVHVDLNPPFVVIGYTPTAQNAEPEVGVRLLTEYESQFKTSLYDLPSALQTKISRLGEYAVNSVDIPELDLGNDGPRVRQAAVLSSDWASPGQATPNRYLCRKWRPLVERGSDLRSDRAPDPKHVAYV